MPLRPSIPDRTRPLNDTTLLVDVPADLFATLASLSGTPGPEKLTRILADQRSRWLAGSPLDTECYLELLPELAEDPMRGSP